MLKRVAILLTQAPHGQSSGREGLDVALATASLCDPNQLGLFFVDDGVLQLLPQQQPQLILSRYYSPAFKLLLLYEIKQCYVCQRALVERGFEAEQPLVIPVSYVTTAQLRQKMQQFTTVLTF